ncbi:MAG: xanthine dehydrogenase family protein molybdopterin-binding subunit [Candidatus Kapabacteria bacterium]|nr:xanthine dehydrogenase family protein molybdopterin-binding subunit [Candidatus Kapabacteria bacterium]
MNIIGKPQTKIDANIRINGEAIYGQDVQLPNMLYGAILRAKYPYSKFKINKEKAFALAGVKAILTAEDVDVENISYRRDHPILKKGQVNSIRDEIAAVAATTKEIALQALELIEVEYEVMDGIFDPFEAVKEDARQINDFIDGKYKNKNIAEQFHYEHGNLDEEKAKSKYIVTERYTLPRMTHACMATSNITADYSKTDGRLTLYSTTQVPFLYQRDIARALKMEPSKVRVIQVVIGGGFGSKLDMYPYEPICALLSMKTGNPVQLVFSREEEFIASPTRQCMVFDLSSGVDENGNFTFREVNCTLDNGAYTSWGATTPFVMMQTFSSLYQCPACNFDSTSIYTNNVYAGSFRGYGNPQATFAIERNIDLLAEKLGMSKAEIRLQNANFQGEITRQGLIYNTCGHKESLEKVIKESQVNSKNHNKSRRYKYGTGYASMLHVGGGAKIYPSDGCGTTLKLDPYGYLTIITGSSEIGQGSETTLAMIAAEELGVSIAKIKVINTDTDIKPWDVGVHASRTSFVAGNSVLQTAKNLKYKISPKAAQMLKTDVDDLVYEYDFIKSIKNGNKIELEKVVRAIHFKPPHDLCIESYFFEPSSEFADREFKGNVSGTYAFAAQAIDVEVDTYTGNVRVIDIHVAQDIGKVLNPLLLDGQIQGGVVQGLGYALIEELQMENGYILNPNFHNYKIPTATDIPKIYFYPVETNDSLGPYGAKGVGEAPLIPTAAAIANAVSDALGVKIDTLPVTPERVLKAIALMQNE